MVAPRGIRIADGLSCRRLIQSCQGSWKLSRSRGAPLPASHGQSLDDALPLQSHQIDPAGRRGGRIDTHRHAIGVTDNHRIGHGRDDGLDLRGPLVHCIGQRLRVQAGDDQLLVGATQVPFQTISLRLGLLAHGDILLHRNEVRDFPLHVGDGCDRGGLPVKLPALLLVLEMPAPQATGGDCLPQRLVLLG